MERPHLGAGRGVYLIIDDADPYGVGSSGPAVQAGSGLTAPGLAEVASWRSATRPASRFQKRSQFFSRAVSARPLQDQTYRKLVYRPLQFHERSQLLIRMPNGTLVSYRFSFLVQWTIMGVHNERA